MPSNLGKVSVYPSQELEYERIPEPNLGPCAAECKTDARRPDWGVYLALAGALCTYGGIAWACGWFR